MKIFLRPRNIKMSGGIAADQREEEEIFYTITPKQVYIYLLNGEVTTLNEAQSSLGYTLDDVNETIVFMCRETIRILFPWRGEFDNYAHDINALHGMISWIREYYGEDYLFNAVCKYYEIAFEPEDFALFVGDLPRPLDEEYGNSFSDDYNEDILQFPYQERGEFYRSYLKTLVVGEEDVDRSVWPCVPAPTA